MTARRSYEGTPVPVSKSQGELRTLLQKFGAQQFSFGEGRDWAGLEFVHAEHLVRVRCPLRTPTDGEVTAFNRSSHKGVADAAIALLDREAMRVWRVLVWTIKARLVAVDEGLETFESTFLSNLVDPSTNTTIWEQMRQPVEGGMFALGGPGLRALNPGGQR